MGYPRLLNYHLWNANTKVSFVSTYNERNCYISITLRPNASMMCYFVQSRPSCSQYVYYIDYLKFMFCTLKLNWNTAYVFLVFLILAAQFFILYMTIKYFCLPNYLMLMRMLPVSQYTYSFVFIGICLFVPDYMSMWMTSIYKDSIMATLKFSTLVGDILRFFFVGILALCINGYRVSGLLWWGNMFYIYIGFIYVLWVVRIKYAIFGSPAMAYDDSHMLTSNAEVMLALFIIVMLLVLVISYNVQRMGLPAEMSGVLHSEYLFRAVSHIGEQINPHHVNLTTFKIWWQTVNGYANMNEHSKFIVTLFLPIYFLLANVIPVFDTQRPMHGWCKFVVCCCFIVFPVLFIALEPGTETWIGILIISWGMSLLICIATNALREPSRLWMIGYCTVGMTMCSIVIQIFCAEINNLVWQYMSMRYFPQDDYIVLLFFSSGEMFVIGILLANLIRHQYNHAAYGTAMGIVTHVVHSMLPWLVLHKGYTADIYIQTTALTQTCCSFFLVMFFGTLFHVSMSGNEFRMSLFFYLVTLITAYICFQLMIDNHWMYPLGEGMYMGPPNWKNFWA